MGKLDQPEMRSTLSSIRLAFEMPQLLSVSSGLLHSIILPIYSFLFFNNRMDKTTEIKAEKAKQLSKPTKHIFMVLLPIPILIAVGVIGNVQGWIGNSVRAEGSEVDVVMSIPEAKVKDLEKDKKYGNYSFENPLSDVNGLGISLDDNSNINSKMLNGETGSSMGISSNDDKTADALAEEMRSNARNKKIINSNEVTLSSQQKKNRAWEKSLEQQRGINRNVNSTVDAMYQTPTFSGEDRFDQIRLSKEEQQRIRANEKLLDLLDKQIQQQGQSNVGASVFQPISNTAPSKNPGSAVRKVNFNVEPHGIVAIGTNGREGGNAFYGLDGRKLRNNRPTKTNGSIRAVVHGDGDGITVTNGSSVAIRMQDETVVGMNDEPIVLPKNTLVYGVARMNGDRIDITVSKIRMDNFIYNVHLQAYDLDGRKGLYVPDMKLKQHASSSIVQGSTQLASPGYIVGGSVGQQVGGQLASQGVGMALNAGKNILTRKAQQPKASIRPNYHILLKSGTDTPETKLDEDEEGQIN